MLLQSIKLVNFRQFLNEEIAFASGKDGKNVTIILGENGTGKTTFAQAFFWCLYGETEFSDKMILNRLVANKLLSGQSAKVSVELVLQHGENTYNNNTPRDMLLGYSDWVNAEWIAKLGLEMPQTLDQFYAMLQAFKNGDPNGNGEADEIPWSFIYNGDGYNMALGAFGFVNARHDIIDGQYVYVPAQENFRHYLEFMAKCYAEGLLDEDIFTMTTDDYLAKVLTLNVGSTIEYNVTSEEEILKRELLSPLTSEYNDKACYPGRSQEKTNSGLCITSNATEEEAIAAIKLLDYWYSQEGTFEIKCGPVYGEDDYINGGYVRTVNEDGTYSYEIIYDEEAFGGSYFDFRMYNGLGNMPFCYTQAHADVIIGANVANKWCTTCVEKSGMLQARRVGYPEGVTFTADEQDTLAMYVLMDSTVDRMVAEFITGQKELNDATWAEYLNTLESMDLETLVSTRQAAYDRWNSK